MVQQGSLVLVNLAPFIGSHARSQQTVRCHVVAVETDRVQVRAEPPCRPICMWVSRQWIDGAGDSPAV